MNTVSPTTARVPAAVPISAAPSSAPSTHSAQTLAALSTATGAPGSSDTNPPTPTRRYFASAFSVLSPPSAHPSYGSANSCTSKDNHSTIIDHSATANDLGNNNTDSTSID
eukprot:CAMPEP_0174244856 /NCGR_PEP_ID=MMETSP0417-20130205/36848_1 /TAXON_ID=242541 /ORGANISM="Mayorella sp, Strain BSH-02190019" /LENGTH=110 /DNA_ID=CAMNT_0015324589 /DNA_START=49 /DNA_END=378 /DNA_ORIENTATION=+